MVVNWDGMSEIGDIVYHCWEVISIDQYRGTAIIGYVPGALSGNPCNHVFVNTGLRKSWCSKCDADAVWDPENLTFVSA
jgi:hypothetical protein